MTTPRILVCGNRDWKHAPTIGQWLAHTRALVKTWGLTGTPLLIHGGNGERDMFGTVIRGADLIANDIALQWGWDIEEHVANWALFGDAAGPMRNAKMAERKPHIGLAFGRMLRNAKPTGTCDMVDRLTANQIPVLVIGNP